MIKVSSLILIIFAAIIFPTHLKSLSVSNNGIEELSRQDQESLILKSTVRILVQSWVVRDGEAGYDIDQTVGHATVISGRYLLTHNHFDIPLSILQRQDEKESYGVVYLYDSQGNPIYKGPLSDFQVAGEDLETLVFVHKDANFLQALGFESAGLISWPTTSLEPGIEVAQVDWDGAKARVDWVPIKEIILDEGVPRLILQDSVFPGASGGGIFVNGRHVANNWQLHEKIDAQGTVIEAVTIAALNSAEIINLQ